MKSMSFQYYLMALIWPLLLRFVVAFPQPIATLFHWFCQGSNSNLSSSRFSFLASSYGRCYQHKNHFPDDGRQWRCIRQQHRVQRSHSREQSCRYDYRRIDQECYSSNNAAHDDNDDEEDDDADKRNNKGIVTHPDNCVDPQGREDDNNEEMLVKLKPHSRRGFVFHSCCAAMVSSSIALLTMGYTDSQRDVAEAFLRSHKKKRQKSYNTATDVSELELSTSLLSSVSKALTVEDCLLQLLPIRNSVFQNLVSMISNIIPSTAAYSGTTSGTTQTLTLLGSTSTSRDSITKKCQMALHYLDSYRGKLEPTFNLNDEDTMLQIMRNERFERLLESLRSNLETMIQICTTSITTTTTTSSSNNGMTSSSLALSLYPIIKSSKITLSEIGELLVKEFPYTVPTEQKFAALPRLLGRARVTFSLVQKISTNQGNNPFQKRETILPLGNVTIVADGYAAPLTAGNFVDLSIRNFYTGLPIKFVRKRWKQQPASSPYEDQALVGSLVGKLENAVVQLESTAQDLAVQTAQQIDEMIGVVGKEKEVLDEGSGGSTSLTPIWGSFLDGFVDPLTGRPRRIPLELVLAGQRSNFYYSLPDKATTAAETALNYESDRVKNYVHPFLTFNIPGLVAMNHPDRNPNGASSEFFILPFKDIDATRVKEINGQYAPFGYVIEGWDLMQSLDPSIEISSTYVGEWGRQNLKKIKQSSFSDVINSSDSTEDSEVSE
jgi:cyclophilin family peptidyl-prolyl cis-trans isomerase